MTHFLLAGWFSEGRSYQELVSPRADVNSLRPMRLRLAAGLGRSDEGQKRPEGMALTTG